MNVLRILILAFTAFCFGISGISAQPITIEKVREKFFTMDKTDDGALKLYSSLQTANLTKDPILLAYSGASSAAAAGSVSGVWKKLDYFNRGKRELQKAVGLKPLDVEIRFLRLATQVNAPGFLGYHEDINTDKALIINTLKSVQANHPNAYLYQRICQFMLKYTELDDNTRNTVSQLLYKFNTGK